MKRAEWIWYPDDFEIELSGRFMAERYERDIVIPPFWRMDSCYKNVKFRKFFELANAETVKIDAEGVFNVMIDGAYLYSVKTAFEVPAGKHEILVSVFNDKGLPCLKLSGDEVVTDDTWQVTCCDHVFKNAACDEDFLNGKTPNNFSLPSEKRKWVEKIPSEKGDIYDFGEEMFGRAVFSGAKLSEGARVYYGESLEEVGDREHCELLSEDFVAKPSAESAAGKPVGGEAAENEVTTKIAKAFRYVTTEGIEFSEIYVDEEISPSVCRSSFECDDPVINEIYKVAVRTMQLCSREFILDGIKRDRWLWGADVYQSSLMHYYSFFDAKSIKRSMIALFGKSPFSLYINHIMDYTFLWIICFDDYYRHSGDEKFARENCYKAFEMMEHCLGRRDGNGLMDSRPEDWVFVDWADLDNSGEVCCEQMLLVAAIKRCVMLSEEFGYKDKAERYRAIYEETAAKLERFWLGDKKGYTYSMRDGKPDGKILMHPNIFAVLFDLCDEERKQIIKENVLENPEIPKIVTPYMRFYELAALCRIGETKYVMKETVNYWGAMIKEGATTFWERYDPKETGAEKYAMYGRKYGKSLCHAWGATPLYIIGRYIVGLKASDNAKSFTLQPDLAGLKRFKVEMPLAKGTVKVEADEKTVKVLSDEIKGTLIVNGKSYVVEPKKETEVAL